MRKSRCKAIKKLIIDLDVGVLSSVAEVYGRKSKDMDPHQIYKAAKHIYTHKLTSLDMWGVDSFPDSEPTQMIVDEALKTNGNNI
jgi:ribosomal protein S19E (S16A)